MSQPPDGIITCALASVKKDESSLSNNGSPCHDVWVGSGDWGAGGGGGRCIPKPGMMECVFTVYSTGVTIISSLTIMIISKAQILQKPCALDEEHDGRRGSWLVYKNQTSVVASVCHKGT